MKPIDINCDVGEGLDNEGSLMPYLSSCNIACTGHAGTIAIIDKTISLAIENKVKIGAHPSFSDTENFGRKYIEMPAEALQNSIEFQINLLIERAALQNVKLNHIKAHGALYNSVAKDESIASTLIKAIQSTAKNVILYVPYNSVIETLAIQNGIKVKREAFIDRNYNDDLSLVSRAQHNALITDPETAFNHLNIMISEEKVTTISNKKVPIKAETFCIHGDNKNALVLLKTLSKQLKTKGIRIA